MTSGVIYETGRVQVWGNAIRKVPYVPLPNREPEVLQIVAPSLPSEDQTKLDELVATEVSEKFPSPSQLKLF